MGRKKSIPGGAGTMTPAQRRTLNWIHRGAHYLKRDRATGRWYVDNRWVHDDTVRVLIRNGWVIACRGDDHAIRYALTLDGGIAAGIYRPGEEQSTSSAS